uniref:Cadherin related family member 4 n=1 Tax=Nomascus leucogenys TaxID=61853 RepID=G1R5D8_NOMLE
MVLLRLLMFLFAPVVSDLCSLPCFINVSESQGPGTILQFFSFNCSSYTPTPTLELLNVQPPATFFNPPSLARWQGTYVGKLTLSSSARLDALIVNHYKLQLKFTCGNHVTEGSLSVDVQQDLSHIQCAGQFASPGETRGSRQASLFCQMSIISAQDPPHFPGPFSINEQGWLQAPSQGLLGQAQKVFQLQISVSFGQRQSCQGMVMVKVLPVPSSQVSFLEQAQNITIPENLAPGSEVVQVRARGVDLRYEILSPVPSPHFSIGRADGVVRTTTPLELARTQGTAVSRLQAKAFEQRQPWASAELNLTMNVQLVNLWPPRCLPALLVSQIPETAPVGTVLNTLTCEDPDSVGTTLDYKLWFRSSSNPASLCLYDRVLEVNATLDCDTPGTCFQHAASILVLDGGQPQMTTEVPVLVMVTPINEFSPACAPRTFRVQEDAAPHTLLGSVVGTDMDYPHDNIEYYTSGGPTNFAVDRLTGEVHLLGPLDYEQQRLYRLTVLLIDHGQDQNPNHHRSGSCTITIEVEVIVVHELAIYAPLGRSVEVTKVSCQIPQEPQRLTTPIASWEVGDMGNSQNQFILQGATLVHSDLVLGPFWPEQPRTYELLIRVADAGPSPTHLSTTATIIVHLVPRRASTVATSTHRTTVRRLLGPSAGWEGWTLESEETHLLPSLLGYSSWHFRLAQLLQAPSKPAQALLLNSIQGTEGSIEGFMEAPKMEMSQAPSTVMSLHFDGRAQDSRTGRDYLFNTHTGARRWL